MEEDRLIIKKVCLLKALNEDPARILNEFLKGNPLQVINRDPFGVKIENPSRLGSENPTTITTKVNFFSLINENRSITRKHPSNAAKQNRFIAKNRFTEI